MKIRIFVPAYNVAKPIARLIGECADVVFLLAHKGHVLEVLVINDNSTDKTKDVLNTLSATHDWLTVHHNTENIGNAGNIIVGYRWGVDSDADVIGCMDGDGEHSPYAVVRHLAMIVEGVCDGVSGSIIFPDHDASYHDRNMMRFWGGIQSALAGVDGMFYIQSPGYNLHQRAHVAGVLGLFEQYKIFFAQNTLEPFPRWGMHGIIIHLLTAGIGARTKAVYLECFGQSPNRSADKLFLQANAANTHMLMLQKFLAK